MAGDAAVRGIRAVDPEGSIKLISAEPDPPYDRPPLSKGLWKGDDPDRIWRGTADLGVDLQLGRRAIRVESHNHTVTDDHGTVHGWEKLLLATGGAPRIFPGAPPQLIHFRTWRDYLALKQAAEKGKKVAVIGGGFIGSELAASLATTGKHVVLLFPEEGISGKVFPVGHARFLNAYYRERGVDVRPQSTVAGVRKSGDKTVLSVQGPDGAPETIRVDVAVAGIGISPCTSLGESAGVEIEDGIVVDGALRTTNPSIWAAGDVATVWSPVLARRFRAEHEDQANTTGEQAGRSMAGESVDLDHLPMFYSDLFDLGYEAVGVMDPTYEVVEDWADPGKKGVLYYLEAGRARGIVTWGIFGKVKEARRLIREGGKRSAADWRGAVPLD
jgi:NADPH-dependent 2,4-dienoyl-CoA reductase/sulfur reductase-like enzyme